VSESLCSSLNLSAQFIYSSWSSPDVFSPFYSYILFFFPPFFLSFLFLYSLSYLNVTCLFLKYLSRFCPPFYLEELFASLFLNFSFIPPFPSPFLLCVVVNNPFNYSATYINPFFHLSRSSYLFLVASPFLSSPFSGS